MEECKLLSELQHPHIVQFVGVWFESAVSRVPVLVMEFLPTTLAQCVDCYGHLPEEITYSVLRDVALGLRYLHERPKPIIHRDLSANNVLLTGDMRAKISDLGVAKILDLDRKKMPHMTKGPGTLSYMPPEAIESDNPSYDSKVDIFSFGVMMVHVFCGQWPEPGRSVVPSTTSDCLIAVSEAGRRQKYLDDIGHGHPLMKLILQCLDNRPRHRPDIADVFYQISSVASRFPPTFSDKIEVLRRMEFEAAEKAKLQRMVTDKNTEIQHLKDEKDVEIRHLKDEKDAEIRHLKDEKESEAAEMQRIITEKNKEIQHLEDENDAEIRYLKDEKGAEIQHLKDEKDAEIQRAVSEKEAEIRRAVSAKDAECQIKIQEKDQQLQTAIQQLVAKCLDEDSKSDLLTWLDESLKQARQRNASNHQVIRKDGKYACSYNSV